MEGLPRTLLSIAGEIQHAGGRSYLVGGWVRDWMLAGKRAPSDCKDYDVEVYGLDEKTLVEILSRHGKPNLVGKAFGVYHLRRRDVSYDFSFPRTESKIGAGHRGFSVRPQSDLTFAEASERRDFTINAMGVELPSLRLEDPHGGERDLEARVLRHVGPAFGEDPLRVLRAVQFSARFGFAIAPETVAISREQDLRELSRERVWDELCKWFLRGGRPSVGWKHFVDLHLERFYPGVRNSGDAEAVETIGRVLDQVHTLAFTDAAEAMAMHLVALCHRAPSGAMPFATAVTQEVRLLRQIGALEKSVAELRRQFPAECERPPEGAAFDTILREISTLAPLGLALEQLRAQESGAGRVRSDLTVVAARAKELGVWYNAPEPWIAGRDLLALGVKPGPGIGETVKMAYQKQLRGDWKNREDALQWLRDHVQPQASPEKASCKQAE